MGRVRVCRDTARRCDGGGRVRMYGAGDGGVCVDTAQTVGQDDEEPG